MTFTEMLNGKSRSMNRRRQQRRPSGCCTAQPLEARLVLVGNVTATFSVASGLLAFTGDAANNDITISVDGVGDAIATGNGGTTINGMASLNISDFTMDALSSVLVNAGDGADVINLSTAMNSIFFPGPVTINGNNGHDTVNVGSTGGQSVSFGSFTIAGGDGDDVVSFASALFVSPAVVIQGNAGNDTYSFDTDNSVGSAQIQENVDAGTDTLNFSTTSARAVAVNLSSAAAQVVNAGLTLTLSAGNAFENVIGGTLGDTLTGNGLANRLTGNNGNDVLNGAAGNDTYVFDTDLVLGSDTINEAGGGVDTLDFSATTMRAVSVNLSNAAAQVVNAGLTLTLLAGNTLENVIGGALGDTLTGNGLANRLTGNNGNDVLNGAAGNDTYVFDTDLVLGSDTINEAGGGVDTLDFSATTMRAVSVNLSNAAAQVVNAGLTLTLLAGNTLENVIGGALGDTLTGNGLANRLTGNNGNDLLTGAAGNDTYVFDTDLTLGSDTINEAGGGVDTLDFSATTTRAVSVNLSNAAAQVVNAGLTLTLLAGNTLENVIGGALGDTLTGNGLANTLTGNNGNDLLTGAAGNDTYVFDTDLALGSDTINEAGGGIDTLDFGQTTTRAVSVNLANAAAQAVNAGLILTLSAVNTMENAVGGSLGDTLTGNSLANSLAGGAGDDTLSGGNGRDILIGGAGMDNLQGGSEEDLLIAGRTTFASDVFALRDLRAEWVRTDISFDSRVAHLLGTVAGGLNGTTVLSSTTVKEDAKKDTLAGGSNRDWYLRNSLGAVVAQRDTVTDADLDSFFTEISTWL